MITLVAVTIWRMGSLHGLPDVGDPFDVAEARRLIEIPKADNAFVAYEAAHNLIDPRNLRRDAAWGLFFDAVWDHKIKPLSWSSSPPILREYLKAKRGGLEIWREGSQRRDALYHQPGELSVDAGMGLTQDANVFTAMAALEGSRIEEAGARNELERSRRTFRLLFANWLPQAERPADHRAPVAIRIPIWIYANDPFAPAAARAVTPEFLARALERMELGFLFGEAPDPSDPPWEGNGELVRERRRRSVLIVRLAAETYRREHGEAPATAGALVGPILKDLPEGIATADPIPPGLE